MSVGRAVWAYRILLDGFRSLTTAIRQTRLDMVNQAPAVDPASTAKFTSDLKAFDAEPGDNPRPARPFGPVPAAAPRVTVEEMGAEYPGRANPATR
jgi:hypothetical protein